MSRVLALFLPNLPLERLMPRPNAPQADAPSNTGSEPPGTSPAVVVVSTGGVLRVAHTNHAAQKHGVRAGETLAQASACAPGLAWFEANAEADRQRLEQLAAWASCLSPVVHIEGADTLLIDVTGCQRLFGGEQPLVRRALEGIRAQGFSVRTALADTAGAAWALAHEGREASYIVPPGETVAALSRLPVRALRIEDAVAYHLHTVGARTIEALLHLPRSALTKRFGNMVLKRLDQALGDAPELLTPHKASTVLRAPVRFARPTDRLEILAEALDHALVVLCDKLDKQVAGVSEIHVTLYFADAGHETLTQRFSRATRSRTHLHKLLRTRLEACRWTARIEALTLWATNTEPLDDEQHEWLAADAVEARELGDLLDRLTTRLGPNAVAYARPMDAHLPEKTYRYESVLKKAARRAPSLFPEAERQSGKGQSGNKRRRKKSPGAVERAAAVCSEHAEDLAARLPAPPLRLLPRPVRVEATSIVPEGPPMRFRFRGGSYEVVDCTGPHCIETGWWRGRHVRRDYYRVTCIQGSRYWLFRRRTEGGWYVHGLFA